MAKNLALRRRVLEVAQFKGRQILVAMVTKLWEL